MVEIQAPPAIEGFRGTLLGPGDHGYDEVRFTWNAMLAWVQGLSDAVRPNSVGTYVNFLGDEGEERIRFAYGSGEKYDRLVELKRAWDHQNLFRLNQNIRP